MADTLQFGPEEAKRRDALRRENELLRALCRDLARKVNEWHDAKTDPEVDDLVERARARGIEP